MTLLAYVAKEDGTIAYVAAGAVLWIEPVAPEKCVIHLARGDWMNCYESADAVARRLDPSVARPGSRVECTCHESARPSSRWRWGECPDCGDRGECSTCKQFDEQMRRAFELSTLPSREPDPAPHGRIIPGPPPTVRGTSVTVDRVVSLIVEGSSWSDILQAYPELTEDDIRACLTHAIESESRPLADLDPAELDIIP